MLRVMTWNLNCGNKTQDHVAIRLPSMREVILAQCAKVLTVQEAPKREQLTTLSPSKFHLAAESPGFSLAILSSLEPQHGQTYEHLAGHHPMVRLTVPHRGSSLNVFTVHLHAGNQPSDEVTREHEIQRILYKIETEVGGPCLQVGDFNFHGDEPGYATLRHAQLIDCFRALHPHEAGVTYEGVHPPQRFDYLFASPGFPLTLTKCEVITTPEAKVASDHLPVVADFE